MDALSLSGSALFWGSVFAITLLVFLCPHGAKGWLALAILCLAGSSGALVLAGICDPRITDRNMALVLRIGGSSLLSSPAEQSEQIAALPDGSMVTLLLQRGKWYYGQLPDGRQGWLLTEGIVPVIPPT